MRSHIKRFIRHCKHEEYDVLIDRTTIWGNPFYIGRDGTRKQVIAKYRIWLLDQPRLLALLPTLRGKKLGCWCGRDKACHGDVLAELANRSESLW